MSAPEAGAPPLPQEEPPHRRRPILCCDEPTCQRRKPLGVYLADLGQPARVYLVTRYTERKGKPGHYVANERHDITEQVKDLIRRNPEWAQAVLRSRM